MESEITDMTMVCITSYFIVSIIAFFGMWKDLENDYPKFYELPRAVRIICRVCAFIFWPIYVIPIAVGLISLLFKRIYDAFVE